ncbi:hypothetical protein [Deinococcus aestuarii]|nr:hypothetical protein [Deinococcus aestuarii]
MRPSFVMGRALAAGGGTAGHGGREARAQVGCSGGEGARVGGGVCRRQ